MLTKTAQIEEGIEGGLGLLERLKNSSFLQRLGPVGNVLDNLMDVWNIKRLRGSPNAQNSNKEDTMKISETYAQGFMDKCAAMGVEPEQLIKTSLTLNPFAGLGNIAGGGGWNGVKPLTASQLPGGMTGQTMRQMRLQNERPGGVKFTPPPAEGGSQIASNMKLRKELLGQ